MMIDTHCHIHESEFYDDTEREAVYQRAIAADVAMLCVGTSEQSSREAVAFAAHHVDTWAIIGVHPHEAKDGWDEIGHLLEQRRSQHVRSRRGESVTASLQSAELAALKQSSTGQESVSDLPGLVQNAARDTALTIAPARVTYDGGAPASEKSHFSEEGANRTAGSAGSDLCTGFAEAKPNDGSGNSAGKIVGIGEIGLDYFYNHSPRERQIEALEAQLQLAVDYDLPVSFHLREAYDDFWPIFNTFHGIRGVLHSFTDSMENLEIALSHGLYIGVNGISTFARDKQAMFDAVPLENMLFETDAPFLTPVPLRGKINEPAFVRNVAEYHAERRHIPVDEISAVTTANARRIFSI